MIPKQGVERRKRESDNGRGIPQEGNAGSTERKKRELGSSWGEATLAQMGREGDIPLNGGGVFAERTSKYSGRTELTLKGTVNTLLEGFS